MANNNNGGLGFWGVVGAIITALAACAFCQIKYEKRFKNSNCMYYNIYSKQDNKKLYKYTNNKLFFEMLF